MQEHRKSRWDPTKVRRTVRLSEIVNDETVVFTTKSFTNTTAEDKYHPLVDLHTGAVSCDCPHFIYRLAKTQPTVSDGEKCKHLQRALETLRRRAILPVAERGGRQ